MKHHDQKVIPPDNFLELETNGLLKTHLHKWFLSRQLNAIFVTLKLRQVSNIFETPVTSQQQIALKITPSLHVRFWSCNFSATKIASSCRDKTRLCKQAFKVHSFEVIWIWISDPGSLRSWRIKETDKSTLVTDSSASLMHNDLSDLDQALHKGTPKFWELRPKCLVFI